MNIDQLIDACLIEDIGDGDHTSLSCVPENAIGKAKLLVKESGIIAGVEIAKKVFFKVDQTLIVDVKINDGTEVKIGDIVLFVEGKSRSILAAERLVLNFMQRMSGIATSTHSYAILLKGLKTKVLDTRKTTPGLREIEKLAVKIGGGENHRMGLYDMIMIKDNHVDFAGGIEKAIQSTREYLSEKNKDLKIEIEARNLSEVKEVLRVGGVDRIMLDNFNPENIKEAVQLINRRFETEASGGITKETLRAFAESGVDFISVGALTHHIKSLDLSLKAIK
jgi:nicotinate-nucleotide pyrophosphorylase (carboxylating)